MTHMQGPPGVARVALEGMLAGPRILRALRRSVVVVAVGTKQVLENPLTAFHGGCSSAVRCGC